MKKILYYFGFVLAVVATALIVSVFDGSENQYGNGNKVMPQLVNTPPPAK